MADPRPTPLDALPPLPAAFAELLDALLPAAWRDTVLASYTEPKTVVWRLNPLRGHDPAQVLPALAALAPRPIDAALGQVRGSTLGSKPVAGDDRHLRRDPGAQAAHHAAAVLL